MWKGIKERNIVLHILRRKTVAGSVGDIKMKKRILMCAAGICLLCIVIFTVIIVKSTSEARQYEKVGRKEKVHL